MRRVILPEWWEDKLAEVPANRALAEGRIAKHLDVPLKVLRDPRQPLSFALANRPRFKHNKGASPDELTAAALVANRAAGIATRYARDLPPFPGSYSVDVIRDEIIVGGNRVNLDSLLEYCWRKGIFVLHLKNLPDRSKKFDAMAMFCGQTPVIVLASGKDGPPWLAFHLAHDLAHVILKHVRPGSSPITDADLGEVDEEADEQAANRFAKELLEGQVPPRVPPVTGTTANRLADQARASEFCHRGLDSGSFVMAFAFDAHGRNENRWAVAQAALKALGLNAGGHEKINDHVRKHLAHDEMPESSARFLEGVLSANG